MGSWWLLPSPLVLCPRIWSMVYMGASLAWVLGSIIGVISGELDITRRMYYLSRDHWPLTSCSVESQTEIAPDHRECVSWELGRRRALRQSEAGGGAQPMRGLVIWWLLGYGETFWYTINLSIFDLVDFMTRISSGEVQGV